MTTKFGLGGATTATAVDAPAPDCRPADTTPSSSRPATTSRRIAPTPRELPTNFRPRDHGASGTRRRCVMPHTMQCRTEICVRFGKHDPRVGRLGYSPSGDRLVTVGYAHWSPVLGA